MHSVFENSSLFIHLILTDLYEHQELVLPGNKLVRLKKIKPVSLTKSSLTDEAKELIADYIDKGFIKTEAPARKKLLVQQGETLEHEVSVPKENKVNEVSVEGITIAMPARKSKDDIRYNINETLEKVDKEAVYWHGVLVTDDVTLGAIKRKHKPKFWERFKTWLSQFWTYIQTLVHRTSR